MQFDTSEARLRVLLVVALLLVAFGAQFLLPLDPLSSGLLVALLAVVGGIAALPGAWPTLYRKSGVGVGAWLVGVAVAAGGIGLTHLLGDPQPFCDGVSHRGCLTLYGWASTFYLAGALGVAIAVGHLDRFRLALCTEVGPANDVTEGPVAVTGRVVPVGDPPTGPVSGEPVVWYRTAVEEPTSVGGRTERSVETGGVPFYVEDGSGRLLVVADDVDPHDAVELARPHTEVEGDRHRREWSYEPNDAVTVLGHATEVSRADYPDSPVVGVDGRVLVGREDRGALIFWAGQRVVVGGVLALLLGGGSLVVMLLAS